MHLTLAKWDVQRWLQTATFGYHEGVDWDALNVDLNAWRNTWVPTLRSIDCLDIEVLIATRTREQQWRLIMKPRKTSKLWRDIRDMKSRVENDWRIGPYNHYIAPHLSLDRWVFYPNLFPIGSDVYLSVPGKLAPVNVKVTSKSGEPILVNDMGGG